jgi:cysteinyl-tRNA synthetase
MLKFYNTLSRKIEELKPLAGNRVGLYACGPTVYNYAHIGNLRTYIFEDLLKRVLLFDGFEVDHAMNITDVGHLVGDDDEGEDKLEASARREGKNPLDIARFYTDKFLSDIDELNIIRPNKILAATEAISEQIEIIKILEQKGFTYNGEQAVYFDTSKLPDYGKLSGQKLSEKKTAAREDVVIDKDKKHPADFALWFFLKGRYLNHILQWDSPWGKGFPGWHIECSAISRKLLGQPFDIHCGGVDHIGTHHTNEIAQSEAAFGLPLADIWMHGEFLLINNGRTRLASGEIAQSEPRRMGKSEGNFITLDTLKEKGFSPLDFRYLCLTAHYRTQLNFTWESLEGSHQALERMSGFALSAKAGQVGCAGYEKNFSDAINDDLNIPAALAVAWELIDDGSMPERARINSLLKFDKVFGLDLGIPENISVPQNLTNLLSERKAAKEKKDFKKSDDIRKQIEALGFEIMDTPQGQKVKRKLRI